MEYVSTFTIPYDFRSPRGTLTFEYYAATEDENKMPILEPGLLNVSTCHNDSRVENIDQDSLYAELLPKNIQYSCKSATDVKVKKNE